MPLTADGKMTKVIQVTINPASVAANVCAEEAFVVKGLLPGMIVVAHPTYAILAGMGIAGVRVTDIDELTINFVNPTAGALDMASGVWDVVIVG